MTRIRRNGAFALFGVATCAVLAMPMAGAEPAPDECSAAGLSATISSVMKSTSDYLAQHPDVNQALLDATRQPAFIAVGQMDGFFSSHPQEADEVRAIQQPARDYQNRCGLAVEPAEAFMALQNL